jgi:hypothetical protein
MPTDCILAGFGVSKTILGTAESDTNRSTAETADYVFSKRTIKPKMLLIVSYLNEYLVNPVHATRERFAGGLIMHCNGGVVCALVEHDHSGVAIRLRLAGRVDPRA